MTLSRKMCSLVRGKSTFIKTVFCLGLLILSLQMLSPLISESSHTPSKSGANNEQRALREVFAERRHVLSNANIANEDNQEALQAPTTLRSVAAAQNMIHQQKPVDMLNLAPVGHQPQNALNYNNDSKSGVKAPDVPGDNIPADTPNKQHNIFNQLNWQQAKDQVVVGDYQKDQQQKVFSKQDVSPNTNQQPYYQQQPQQQNLVQQDFRQPAGKLLANQQKQLKSKIASSNVQANNQVSYNISKISELKNQNSSGQLNVAIKQSLGIDQAVNRADGGSNGSRSAKLDAIIQKEKEIVAQTQDGTTARPEKLKNWETYDYENPYNLLEIHVDRAPQHNEAQGTPWPMPQEYITEWVTHAIDLDKFSIQAPVESCGRIDRAIDRYQRLISSKRDLFIPDDYEYRAPSSDVRRLTSLQVRLSRSCADTDLPHEHMSEQYKLYVNDSGAVLTAPEQWGIIRGLETFSQLIYYTPLTRNAVINTTYVKDFPRFGFRGLMLDTARHFIPVEHIMRVLDVMSYTKLNVFHWHIVDDQSFPYVSEVFPDLSKKGAYSKAHIYTAEVIKNMIEYAADRAIRLIPEFDTPGHTRSWGLGYPDLLTKCSDKHHPFGAVNPLSNYTYEFMHQFWKEVHDRFPDSTVHIGGDEINYKCWLRVKEFRDFMVKNNMTKDEYSFLRLDGDQLQGYYLKRLMEVMPKDRKKIAWEEAFAAAQLWNISTDELIINVWKGGDYEWQLTMESVIRRGYKAILSAPWYLNYISYGRDWTKYYEQDPHNFLLYSSGAESYKESVLGGQVCMWAEFIDESNLEPTLWPRANAPAEKLWSSMAMRDWKAAEVRFENHRCRLARRGIRTQPNSGPGACFGTMKIKPPYDAGY